MHGAAALSSLDLALLATPFAAFLILAMCGLDERFATEKHPRRRARRRFCEVDRDGHGLLCDPHGRFPQAGRISTGDERMRGNRFITGTLVWTGTRRMHYPVQK